MKQPTYQQVSELYHELWEIQHKLDDVESERDSLKECCKQESQYNDYLLRIVLNARYALKTRDYETLEKELNKV